MFFLNSGRCAFIRISAFNRINTVSISFVYIVSSSRDKIRLVYLKLFMTFSIFEHVNISQ